MRLDRVLIVGDGPLRGELEARAAEVGVADVVEFTGERTPAEVRAALHEADVLAAPCVVAQDGDRDTMPVVVKEALAMEIPVVASDEVGLPEVVRPEWGRLVPPGDATALAAALDEVLSLPPDERAAMGRRGREFVAEHCDVSRETAKLADWIATAVKR
jgi:glycosyltransferase involved in cell wall biosynthesis